MMIKLNHFAYNEDFKRKEMIGYDSPKIHRLFSSAIRTSNFAFDKAVSIFGDRGYLIRTHTPDLNTRVNHGHASVFTQKLIEKWNKTTDNYTKPEYKRYSGDSEKL